MCYPIITCAFFFFSFLKTTLSSFSFVSLILKLSLLLSWAFFSLSVGSSCILGSMFFFKFWIFVTKNFFKVFVISSLSWVTSSPAFSVLRDQIFSLLGLMISFVIFQSSFSFSASASASATRKMVKKVPRRADAKTTRSYSLSPTYMDRSSFCIQYHWTM